MNHLETKAEGLVSLERSSQYTEQDSPPICLSCGCPIEPNADGYPDCGCQWAPAHMKAQIDDI